MELKFQMLPHKFLHFLKYLHYFLHFLKNKNDLFKDGNSVYTYGTEVYDKFKRMGYGTKLRKKCHELAKNNNYNYVMSIVSKDNTPSQKMQKNVGYKLHQCNDIKDLLYYTVV